MADNADPNLQYEAAVRNYTVDHPALARLIANADDDPAAGINVGNPINDANEIAAFNQYITRMNLLMTGRATQQEVMEARQRHFGVMLDSSTPFRFNQHLVLNIMIQMNQDIVNQGERLIQSDAAIVNQVERLDDRLVRLITQSHEFLVRLVNENVNRINQRFDQIDQRFNRIEELLMQHINNQNNEPVVNQG